MSRALRLQRIEELLLSVPDGFTTAELADKLDVHRTTIWRDLNELSCHAPVQQIDDRYLIDRSDYLSSIRLSHGESLMLYLTLRRMTRHPSLVPPMMQNALEKLLLTLRHPSAEQLSDNLETMRAHPATLPEQARIWELLVQAWMKQITVRVTYQEARQSALVDVDIQPYLFEPAIVGEGVYLIGHSLQHNQLRAFKVERITSASLTTERFVRPDNVVVDTMLRQVWGMWYGEELTEVRLRFWDPDVAERVRTTLWFPSQITHELPDGGVEWIILCC